MVDYMEMLDTAELLIGQLRPFRQNQEALDMGLKVVAEFRWNATFNQKFREQTTDFLAKALDDLYVEIQGELNEQEEES